MDSESILAVSTHGKAYVGSLERHPCPASCWKKPLKTYPENYSMYVRWRGGGGGGGRKQVVGSSDYVLYAVQSTPKVYSGSVVRIYTWDVKSCGGPGWNTVYVRKLKCGLLKNLKCKCWSNNYLCVLLQIIYLDNIASPAVLLNEELENVSVDCLISVSCIRWVTVLNNENE